MTFDPVKQFIDQKRAYIPIRGTMAGGAGSGYFPLTTTMDVYVFSRDFFRATQKSENGVLEAGSQALAVAFGAGPTASYENAVKAWKRTWPSVWDAAAKPSELWWDNQRFWEMGSKYAIARSAVGSVPGHWTLLKESVAESAADLYGALIPRIDWWKWGSYAAVGFVGYKALKS